MSGECLKVFITGATGFIGKALALNLLSEGHLVTLLIRSEDQKKVFQERPFQFVTGDLGEGVDYKGTLNQSDLVIHAASIRNRWNTSPQKYEEINIKGTENLIKSAAGRVKRFVYISSVGVYGFPGVLGINENFPQISNKKQLDYHTSKIMAEKLVKQAPSDLETVILRPTITYGPGDIDGMLTKLIVMLHKGINLQIGAGINHVHLTYIDDLVNGIKLAAFHPQSAGNDYILAGQSPIQIKVLADLIMNELKIRRIPILIPKYLAEICGNILEWAYKLDLPFLPQDREPSITLNKVNILAANRGFSFQKAAKEFGFNPLIDYQTGVHRTISWLNESGLLG